MRSARPTRRWSRFRRTEHGDPVLRACGQSAGPRAAPQSGRVSVDGRRLWRPRRRLGGRDNAARSPDSARGCGRLSAERGWQDFGERRGIRGRPCCASPAFTDRGVTRSPRLRAAMRGASSRPARFSTASMSRTSRRRSTPRSRGVLPAFSMLPTTSRRRPATRSHLRRSSSACRRRPKSPTKQAEAGMSPLAKSFWQECRRVNNDKLKRELGVTLRLSDLSGRITGAV